jgi:hypothetical protein|tara:strand:+ start:13828 stop:15141 length:1314 start_codon:yes stop_codon:yes gene_type:complete
MASNAKTLGSSGVLYTDRRDFYMRPNVVKELWTDVTPFTTVIANQQTISGMADPQFKMFEHRNPWQKQYFQTSTSSALAADNAADTWAVTAGSVVGLEGEGGNNAYNSWIGLECEVWTGLTPGSTNKGVVLITAVSSSGASANFSVKNMTSASLTPASGDYLVVVGNAFGEGTVSGTAWSDELSVVYNQCQIFKTPLEITGTLLQASLRGESSELARLRDQKSQEHKIQKERAFLFGRSPIHTSGAFSDDDLTDANGNQVRSTMGIVAAIEKHGATSGSDQSVFSIAESSYAYGDFVDDMEKVFQYVPEAGMKRAFCGPGALGYWSKMAGSSGMAGNSGWTVNLGDMKRDALGFNYRMLETPHGVLQLIPTPVLRDAYNKHMLVVSDENLFHAQYRAPKFQANIKTDDGYDGVKDQYMSDEGIGVTLIESHKLFKIS